MKKKITVLISALLAFVMCFAMLACGSDDDGGMTKSQAIDKAVAALENLYIADGYTGSVDYKETTAGGSYEFSASIDKRGDKMNITEDGATDGFIVDTATGLGYYVAAKNGETPQYVVRSLYPSNLVDYVLYTVNKQLAAATDVRIDEIFGYNASTRTLTLNLDYKDMANAYLEPLYNAYHKKRSVSSMLDDYIGLATNDKYDLEEIFMYVTVYVQQNSDKTVGELVNVLTQLGVDVDDLLYRMGITLTEEQAAAVMTRTVAEAFTGLSAYFDSIGASGTNGFGSLSFQGLFNAVLLEPVTVPENVGNTIGNVFDLVRSVLSFYKVNTLVDEQIAKYSPELYTAITEQVTFKTLKGGMTLKFDNDYNVSELYVYAEAEHTYTASEAEDFKFLIDNNYKYEVELKIDEYAAASGAFDIAFVPDADPRGCITLVYGDIRGDIPVYVEKAGNTLNVENVKLVYYTADDTPVYPDTTDIVRWDDERSSVFIDGAYLRTFFASAPDTVLVVMLECGEDRTVNAWVRKMPDDPIKAIGSLLG